MKQSVNRLLMHRKKGLARPFFQKIGSGLLAHVGTPRSLVAGAPTYVNGSVEDAADNVVVLNFSETIFSPSGDYGLGFTINWDIINTVGILTANRAPGDDQRILIATDHVFLTGQVIIVSYADTTGDITDLDDVPHPLASFTDQPVANNVLP